jgi:hypothetical protein
MLLLALPLAGFMISKLASVSVACSKKHIWGILYNVARVWPWQLNELNEMFFAWGPEARTSGNLLCNYAVSAAYLWLPNEHNL